MTWTVPRSHDAIRAALPGDRLQSGRAAVEILGKVGGVTLCNAAMRNTAIRLVEVQDAELGFADARPRSRAWLSKHGFQLARRAADDLEHLGGRGLLLSDSQISCAAQLVEQPRVLDRDHRLRGEVLHQLDLLVGERPHLLAVDDDRADQLVVLEHRHDRCMRPPRPTECAGRGPASAGIVQRSRRCEPPAWSAAMRSMRITAAPARRLALAIELGKCRRQSDAWPPP